MREKTLPVCATAPERIFLQVSNDERDDEEPFPDIRSPEGCDICWSPKHEVACEVQYVRADLAEQQAAEIERLRAAHDHQHGIAGTMLRETERYGRENERLRAALQSAHATIRAAGLRALEAGDAIAAALAEPST